MRRGICLCLYYYYFKLIYFICLFLISTSEVVDICETMAVADEMTEIIVKYILNLILFKKRKKESDPINHIMDNMS